MKKSDSIVLRCSVVAALAGFLFGFDTIVISGAEKQLELMWGNYTFFGESSLFHGWIVVASALWGTVVGAIIGSYPTNLLGRKKTLIFIGIFYFISALGAALVSNPYTFSFLRFLGGLGVGISTIAAPAYISEISPPHKRGRLVALFQFNIVFGIVIALISNYFLKDIGKNAWRWMIGIEAIPALIYTLLTIKIPRSPRWLIIKKNFIEEATKIINTINPSGNTKTEIEKILTLEKSSSGKEHLFLRKYRFPLMLAVLIALFNQFSGINAIFYYAPRIFEEAGLGKDAAFSSSIGLGIVNLIFTLIGLALIDKFGRKLLMYLCSFGYILSLSLVSYVFYQGFSDSLVPILLFLFIASHAIGQGTVIWVFIAEIFPNHLRAGGQSVGSSTHWIFAAIIPAMIPFLFKKFTPWPVFAFFAFMMVIQLIWVIFVMPETKGKSLEEIDFKSKNT